MDGLELFVETFGHVSVAHVAIAIVIIVFLYKAYKKFADYLMKRHDAEQLKNAELQEALTAVRKYPEYRQQSLDIQKAYNKEFAELHDAINKLSARLEDMERVTTTRERNRIRDRLLQAYRYYTNPESNPGHTWTQMESEAFWEMFKDYEVAGGNGYMHTHVQPAMLELTVIEVQDAH